MLAALLLLNPGDGDPPASRESGKLTLHLGDGSRLRVASPKDELLLKTEYGEQRIPFGHLRFLRRLNDLEITIGSSSVTATGELLSNEFFFDSAFGRIRIPSRELIAASGFAGNTLLLDTNTVACWSFSEPLGDVSLDLVKKRPLTFRGMEVTTQGEGGGAAVRLNDSGFAEAATDEALEVAGGNFTLEARFKTGAVPKGYASIFSKNDRANGQICDFLLYVQPGNTIHFQSVSPRGTYGWNVPGAMVKADEWAYVAVVVQPEQQKITFYVNGKMVHEIRQAFQFCAQGTPVFIGESPAYTGLGAPEKVQFVRLSKVARTAAEIADFQSCLQNAPVVLWGSGSRGLSLRDGAYLRAELPKIAGISFRTRYGNLRLDEKSTGEICVYRFRPGDLSRVEGEVKQLIEKLGESGIAERDEARLKLLEFGEAALAQLRKNSGSSDSEIRKRIEAILAKLEERGMAAKPVADVLRVGSTVLHGWLEAETLEAASRFGTFDIPVGSIESIRLGDGPAPGTPFLRLKSGERLEGELQRGSAVVLDTGFGGLTIPIREITALTADSGAETWTVRTDRLSAKGKLGQGEFQIQTPAGRLKIPLAEVSEIVRKP